MIPKSWTEAVGVSEGMYHASAVGIGTVAGVCTVVGMAILIYRRRTVGPVFSATTRMDKAMYAVLGTVIVLGLANTWWPTSSATTTTATASRSGSAASSGSTRSRS